MADGPVPGHIPHHIGTLRGMVMDLEQKVKGLEARIQELETACYPLADAGRALEQSGRTPGTVLISAEDAIRAAEILFKEAANG